MVAAVARVGVFVIVGSGRLSGRVGGAGVADKDDALLDGVASTTVGGAAVNGVLVVETPASRV